MNYKEYVNYYVKLSEDMGLKLEQEDIDAPDYYYDANFQIWAKCSYELVDFF